MTDQQLLGKIETLMNAKFEPINQQLRSHTKHLNDIKETVEYNTIDLVIIKGTLAEHTKDIKKIKSSVKKTKKTLDIVAIRYDERIIQNTKAIEQIKNHIGLPS
jgi:hypothetical protein